MGDTPFCPYCGTKQSIARHKRGNGLGSVYREGQSSTWIAQIVVGKTPEGRMKYRRKYGFLTKKEAIEYLAELKQKKEIKPARTLRSYYESWLESDAPKLSKSKQTAYRIAWNKIYDIHDTNVSDLSVLLLRDVVSEAAPTFYPARDIKSLLSHIFKLAIADGLMNVNMSEYITLPSQNESERTPWTNEEISTMWSQYDQGSQMAAYLLLMTYTGMMPGELLSCRKDMINLDKQQIIGAGLKTDVRKQIPIAIPAFLIPVIESILTFTPDDHEKLIRRNKWDFYKDYHAFTAEAGIRDLPMYSCRHTTATALAVGTSAAPSVIMKAMRHSKFTTTQRYIHPDTKDVVSALNELQPSNRPSNTME